MLQFSAAIVSQRSEAWSDSDKQALVACPRHHLRRIEYTLVRNPAKRYRAHRRPVHFKPIVQRNTADIGKQRGLETLELPGQILKRPVPDGLANSLSCRAHAEMQPAALSVGERRKRSAGTIPFGRRLLEFKPV